MPSFHVLEGVRVPIATVEDLVTMKILAGRPKDLDDAEGMLRARSEEIDLDHVRRMLQLLGGGAVAERSAPSTRSAHPPGEAFRAVIILKALEAARPRAMRSATPDRIRFRASKYPGFPKLEHPKELYPDSLG